MSDERARVRFGLGLGAIAFALFLLPWLLNVVRGGAEGVGVDPARDGSELRFIVRFPPTLESGPVDGRLVLVVSRDVEGEPRFQVGPAVDDQQVFGLDVAGWRAGDLVEITDTVFGFPLRSLAMLPPGDYWVQGMLNRYETVRLPSGPVVSLPVDRGPGRAWERRPGSLVSPPVRVHLDPRSDDIVRVELSRRIPDAPAVDETPYLRQVRMRSELLSEFWGREVRHEAVVLLPRAWSDHPDARFPVVVYLGQGGDARAELLAFRADSVGSRPSDTRLLGSDRALAARGHELHTRWTRGEMPAVIVVAPGTDGPRYGPYAGVSSANAGPLADALLDELIPEVEARYRGMGQSWARGTYGGWDGGWAALAMQILHPGHFNGAWVVCPDPVDFRALGGVNLMTDANAYRPSGASTGTPRPGGADRAGPQASSLEHDNHFELIFGSRGRSGGTWDARQANFSPRGDDGYPRPIWDKVTGEIDAGVASYWRDHYDLGHILQRDWSELAPRLAGKLHLFVGRVADDDRLESLRLLEAFLETAEPHYEGVVVDRGRMEHCSRNGVPGVPMLDGALVRSMLEQFERAAPRGVDVRPWRS